MDDRGATQLHQGRHGREARCDRRLDTGIQVVPSNFACIGLAVDGDKGFDELVRSVLPDSVSLGVVEGLDVRRWEDPSGSRLILGVRNRSLVDVAPSFAADPEALLDDVGLGTGWVVNADVVDARGEMMTRLTFLLEEAAFLTDGARCRGASSIVALGSRVTLHEGADAFAASPSSLLDPADEGTPEYLDERGMKRPFRMAAESFISYGTFQSERDAYARLSGTVLSANRLVVAQTGQEVITARVRTVGFVALVCLPGSQASGVPEPGTVIAGDVYLTGSMPSVTSREGNRHRRWIRRR